MKLRVRCRTPEEPLYLFIAWKKEERIGVCERCWTRISEKDWDAEDLKRDMGDILSDKMRFGENPIPTEYVYRGKVLETKGESDEDEET